MSTLHMCTLAHFFKRQKQETFINVVIAYPSVEDPAMELAEATVMLVMLQTGKSFSVAENKEVRTEMTIAIRRITRAMRNELCCIQAQPL